MITPRYQTDKITVLVTILFLFALLTLRAKDFWEEKPFTYWNEKEAYRILSDSPWGKSQNVSLLGNESDFREVRQEPPGVPPTASAGGARGTAGGDVRSDSTTGRSGAAAGRPGYGGEPGGLSRSIPFQISWYSSLKVRQAMGRLGQLHGKLSTEQINDFAQQPMENYVIAISGSMMKPFEQATLESLKAKTFLLSKKDKKKKIELKEYMSPKDRKDGMALFVFPRTADGKPLLDVADDEAQFVTEQEPLRIKVSFKLSKMMVDGKLDI
jgi:hypothetical protein